MVHAHAAPFRPTLDPKRIAATSAVIALHVGVLMMLMMPIQRAQPVAVEDVVPPWIPVKLKEPPPPPPPKQEHPKPQPPQAQVPRTQIAPPDPPPRIYQDTASQVDTPPIPLPPEITIVEPAGSGSPFVELATRMSPPPAYPRLAITRGWSGTVLLRIHVDASGRPMEVTVEQSSGHDLLDQAAIKVVKAKWLFVPATQNGAPTDAWARVPVEFVLN
jgi:protein TonB